MNLNKFSLKPLFLAAAMCCAGASHAAITAYTNSTTFATAANSATYGGTDTFLDLSINTSQTGPLARLTGTAGSAGPGNLPSGYVGTASSGLSYNYSASTVASGGGAGSDFYIAPAAGTVSLSTNQYNDKLQFDTFSSNVRAFGSNMYGTLNSTGEATSLVFTVTATDVNNVTNTQSFTGSGTGSFLGFVSDVALQSVLVSVTTPLASGDVKYATVDNLILSSVPEPETYALLLAGLGLVGALARRKARA